MPLPNGSRRRSWHRMAATRPPGNCQCARPGSLAASQARRCLPASSGQRSGTGIGTGTWLCCQCPFLSARGVRGGSRDLQLSRHPASPNRRSLWTRGGRTARSRDQKPHRWAPRQQFRIAASPPPRSQPRPARLCMAPGSTARQVARPASSSASTSSLSPRATTRLTSLPAFSCSAHSRSVSRRSNQTFEQASNAACEPQRGCADPVIGSSVR